MVIAGHPAMGTTTLAVDFLRTAVLTHRLPAVMFTRDASLNDIGMRLLAAEARVARHRMRSGHLTDDDWGRLARKMPTSICAARPPTRLPRHRPSWSALQGRVPPGVVGRLVEPKFLRYTPPGFDAGEDGQHRTIQARRLKYRVAVPAYEWLSDDEIRHLIEVTTHARDRLLVALLAAAGMRIGEVPGLRSSLAEPVLVGTN